MTKIVVSTPNVYPLDSLVGVAIENEANLLRAGIERTRAHISAFEAQYMTTSEEFERMYENDEWAESLESIEWLGELRMLEHLEYELKALRDVSIEN